jgi:hypothetical protein
MVTRKIITLRTIASFCLFVFASTISSVYRYRRFYLKVCFPFNASRTLSYSSASRTKCRHFNYEPPFILPYFSPFSDAWRREYWLLQHSFARFTNVGGGCFYICGGRWFGGDILGYEGTYGYDLSIQLALLDCDCF